MDILLMLAYLGPGLGGGVIALVIGILTALGLALFSFLLKPFRKLMGYFRSDDSREK